MAASVVRTLTPPYARKNVFKRGIKYFARDNGGFFFTKYRDIKKWSPRDMTDADALAHAPAQAIAHCRALVHCPCNHKRKPIVSQFVPKRRRLKQLGRKPPAAAQERLQVFASPDPMQTLHWIIRIFYSDLCASGATGYGVQPGSPFFF